MNWEETIEVEIDSELLGIAKLAAAKQGLTTEQYISQIVEKYVEERKSIPLEGRDSKAG